MGFMVPELIEVAREGKIDGLKQLILERGASILDQVTPMGNTLLHVAAMFEHLNFLIEVCGLSPSLIFEINLHGDTALHVGARVGHLAIVNHLINRMASCSFAMNMDYGSSKVVYLLGSQNHRGDTVLHEALRNLHRDVAKLLLEKDPNLSHLVNNANESPLYLAVTKGYGDVVDQILQSSSSPAYCGPKGWTALHACSLVNVEGTREHGASNMNMTKKLLQVKPELARVGDIYWRTPLHYAVVQKNLWIVHVLLEHDASLAYLQDIDGCSPLHLSVAITMHSWKTMKIIEEIIEFCPDSECLLDNSGNNFLHLLIMRKERMQYRGMISTLLSSLNLRWNVLLNQTNNDGNTPLHLATLSRNKEDVIDLTKDKRVDKAARNNINNLTAHDIASYQWTKSLRQREVKSSREWSKIVEYVRTKNDFSRFGVGWMDILKLNFVQIIPKEEDDEEDAEEKFHKRQEEFRRKLSKTHMVVATLIATVAFAAALQIPGGYDSGDGDKRGMATLAGEAAFGAFVISDVIALSCSLLTLLLYFFADIVSTGDRPGMRTTLVSIFLILVAIVAMIVAFMCGVFAVLVKTHSLWIGIVTILLCLSVPFIGCSLSFWPRHRDEDSLPE